MKRLIALILAVMMIFVACKRHDGNISDKNIDHSSTEEPIESDSKLGKLLDSLKVQKPIQPDFKLTNLTSKISDYEIEDRLQNVERFNYDSSNSYILQLAKEYKDYGFVVNYSTMEQPFSIYEDNQYNYNNSFITTDSVLHLYHIIYIGMMEKLEQNQLLGKLKAMSKAMYEASLKDYNDFPEYKDYTKKNAALYLTALYLLNEADGINAPSEIDQMAQEELKNIEAKTTAISAITGENVSYSQFTVRGNYTKNAELKSYFLASMLYSQNALTLVDDENEVDRDKVKSAIIMARTLGVDENARNLWKEIFSPISFLVENTEEITPLKMNEIVLQITRDADLKMENIASDDTVKKVCDEVANFEKPEIFPEKGVQMSILPQRAVVDNRWMQQLINEYRPVAAGTDVMAVMGNKLAEQMTLENPANNKWNEFKEKFAEVKEKISVRTDDEKRSNIYRSWLWVLEGFNQDYDEKYPFFMRNGKWKLKDLNSSLASWAQLKHDTALYTKQFGAEMGGVEPVKTQHYVEPNVDIYRRLIWLCDYTMQNSDRFNLLDDTQKARLNDYKDMLEFLERVSIQELETETISDADNERLDTIAGEMEKVFTAFYIPPEGEDEYYLSPSERNTANIIDIQQIGTNAVDVKPGQFLEVGSGTFSVIYVLYRVNGKYYTGSGSIMNYYEFLTDERWTDEDFRSALKMTFDMPEETTKELPTPDPLFQELYFNYGQMDY